MKKADITTNPIGIIKIKRIHYKQFYAVSS